MKKDGAKTLVPNCKIMSRKYRVAGRNRGIRAALSLSPSLPLSLFACLLEVAAKHISKTTAITSAQWHAIYTALPGEINFVVTTHKINNSGRNSGHSSAERKSIITDCELQHTGILSLSLWNHLFAEVLFPHVNVLIVMSGQSC